MKVTTDGCLFGGSLPPAHSIGERMYNVLDIGTGMGLLSLMFAQKNEHALIDAIEIDGDAAQQAKENVEASPWKDRITVINADARYHPFERKYDIIFSNPPFYEDELKSDNVNKNIARHSEELNLQDVLTIIESNMAQDGVFSLLLPYKRYTEIKNHFTQSVFELTRILFVKQSPEHNYFRMIYEGRFRTIEAVKTKIEEIVIADVQGNYTAEFTNSLQLFYLNL